MEVAEDTNMTGETEISVRYELLDMDTMYIKKRLNIN